MNVPNGATTCLYAGICSKIEFLKTHYADLGQRGIEIYLKEISEAISFFNAYCITSSSVHLEFKYAELAQMLRNHAAEEVNAIGQTKPNQPYYAKGKA